ncbi:MAG TPA: PQQ-binding-like beta-propeller repeat protein, partial [Acidimicrobiales bacterium]|nr:PQQ-binding-like beta-propeller repeat protein [Acidimicrobiales bacterium]
LALYGDTLWVLSFGVSSFLSSHHRTTLTALDAATGRAKHVVTFPYPSGPYKLVVTAADLEGALVTYGPDLFLAAPFFNEVIELDASSGRLVRVIAGPQFDFRVPTALATIGPDLFVANGAGQGGGSVTEIDAETGALVQVIAGKPFHFAGPVALATWGPYLFVVNAGKAISGISTSLPPGSVTEVDTYASLGSLPTSTPSTSLPSTSTTSTEPTTTASTTLGTITTTTAVPGSGAPTTAPIGTTTTAATATTMTGASTTTTMVPGSTTTTTTPSPVPPQRATLVRVVSEPKLDFAGPGAAVVSNGQLFVTTSAGPLGAVLVMNASTGALEEVLDRSSCQFASPTVLQLDGDEIFVGSQLGGVTQLSGGRCVRTVEGSTYGFHLPTDSTVSDGELFVANSFAGPSLTGSITELNASTGAFSRVLAQPAGSFGTVELLANAKSLYVVTLFGQVLQLNANTGAVTRRFNEPDAPFGGIVTGAILYGSTIYESEALGGLSSVNTMSGRVRHVVAAAVSSFETAASNGIPTPMVFYGKDLFYLSSNQSGKVFIEEVDTATGKVVRDITAPSYQLGPSSQMTLWGNDLFVTNPALPTGKGLVAVLNPPAGSLTEIDATTGRMVRRISGARYDFHAPEEITAVGNDLFVADSGANAVTEVDPSKGQLVGVLSGSQYQFESPVGLDVYGDHLYVINESGDSVTDIDLRP